MILAIAGVFGASSIAFGAYGAHKLKTQRDEKTYETFRNAIHYQQLHSIVLLVLVILTNSGIYSGVYNLFLTASSGFFVAGILLFSGSIYMSIFANKASWTKITPLGGLSFIIGWLLLALTGAFTL